MELFVFAHEYAHHIKGHLDSGVQKAPPVQGRDLEFEIFTKSQQNEFEADHVGFELFVACSVLETQEEFQVAPLVVMGWFALVDLIESSRPNSGIQILKTHPTAAERNRRLVKQFSSIAAKNEKALVFLSVFVEKLIIELLAELDTQGFLPPKPAARTDG
jgi:hypothetical protein